MSNTPVIGSNGIKDYDFLENRKFLRKNHHGFWWKKIQKKILGKKLIIKSVYISRLKKGAWHYMISGCDIIDLNHLILCIICNEEVLKCLFHESKDHLRKLCTTYITDVWFYIEFLLSAVKKRLLYIKDIF